MEECPDGAAHLDRDWFSAHGDTAVAQRAVRSLDGFRRFLLYYGRQPAELLAEWGITEGEQIDDSKCVASLLTPLPAVIRVNTGCPHRHAIMREVLSGSNWSQLAWYPGGLALQCDGAKFVADQEMRSKLKLKSVRHEVRFQEAVSMLPPLLLSLPTSPAVEEAGPSDGRADDGVGTLTVLDLCAAPGSKTIQIIEMLAESHVSDICVVANEKDRTRCGGLERLQRAANPAVVTTLSDGSRFPVMLRFASPPTESCADGDMDVDVDGDGGDGPSGARSETSQKVRQMLFDRVLVDAPCSGDGTTRKNPGIFRHWEPLYAYKLHRKQVALLTRALHLAAPGGVVVYSTCSLNPVENEAVVAQVLRVYGASIELQDAHACLSEELERRGVAPKYRRSLHLSPGVAEWAVQVGGSHFSTWKEVHGNVSPEISASLFSCICGPSISAAECRCLSITASLRRCIRVVPHLTDTGGFFIAVLRKRTHEIPQADQLQAHEDRRCQHERMELTSFSWRGRNEKHRFFLLSNKCELWRSIVEHFGLGRTLQKRRLYAVLEQNTKGRDVAISLCTRSVLQLLDVSFQGKRKGPELWAAGCVVLKPMRASFVRSSRCRWRPAQHGCALFAPLCSKRVVLCTKQGGALLLDGDHQCSCDVFQSEVVQASSDAWKQVRDSAGPLVVGVQLGCGDGIGGAPADGGVERSDGPHFTSTGASAQGSVSFWIPAVCTGTCVIGFAQKEEVAAFASAT